MSDRRVVSQYHIFIIFDGAGSSGLQERRARHLPRASFFRAALEVFRAYIFLISGQKGIIHSYDLLRRRSQVRNLLSKGPQHQLYSNLPVKFATWIWAVCANVAGRCELSYYALCSTQKVYDYAR